LSTRNYNIAGPELKKKKKKERKKEKQANSRFVDEQRAPDRN